MKAKFFIFLIITSGILLLALLYFPSMQKRSETYDFLPQLKHHDLHSIKFKKIYADPSYLVPYNILITFKSDDKTIIDELGLKGIEAVDTAALKRSSWVEEYELYFSMSSVNAVRYSSIKKQLDEVKWWGVSQCSKNYVAPYLDDNNKRGLVPFNQRNNGRVVCCKSGDVYFLLIECWG